jgi:hypothetical protein
MIALHILMSYSITMIELENSRVHSVGITMVCTNVRSALAGVFIVRDVSLNNIYLIHYIELRCVLFMWQHFDLTIFTAMEWIFLRVDIFTRSWVDRSLRTPRKTVSLFRTSTG